MEREMYVKTIDLWSLTDTGETVHDRLMRGTLILRCGQWVRTHPGSRPSRWVGAKRTGTLWASHWQGYGGGRFRREQFMSMAQRLRDYPQDFYTTTPHGE